MDIVELGGTRLHLLAAHPGLPGEADRIHRALARIAPALIAADVDTDDALRMRASLTDKKPYEPGVVDKLFHDETRRRFAPDVRPGEHPMVAAARYARDRRADYIPLRPLGEPLGYFTRRKLAKAVSRAEATRAEDVGPKLAHALQDEGLWDPTRDVHAAHKRLMRALTDGRAPVVAVLHAHRREAYEDAILQLGRIPA